MRFSKQLARASATAFLGLAMLMPSIANAAVVSIHFNGVLTQAENYTNDDPTVAQGDFFQVGQKISGDLTWDTDAPADTSSGAGNEFELLAFNLNIGGMDFSDRFFPRSLITDPSGNVSFLSGGADQGGGARIDMNIGKFGDNAPDAGDFDGRKGSFAYSDFYPLGGVLEGRIFVGDVPEPATWIMMILGFGTIAGTMRRRKERAFVTA
jgi:hypothetical protein